jgi:hypothetical protein
VKLEGSLDAFGLSDVVTLLASTGKSGGLLLRRAEGAASVEGVVWLREGRICGATSDRARSSLVRRVVGSGAVDDSALRQAVARVVAEGGGVAKALLEAGAVEPELLAQAASEQTLDAVFDLLRWTEGSFTFDPEAHDPDGVGISLEPTRVLGEATARVESWQHLAAVIPGIDSVLAVPVVLHHDPEVTRDEWALLALVDGHRRVRDLVELTGAGDFAVTTTLAHLVQRGLLHVKDSASPDHVTVVERRLAMLASIEDGREAPAPLDVEPGPDPEPIVVAPTRAVQAPGHPGAGGMTAAAALAAARAAQGLAPVGAPARPVVRPDVMPTRTEPFAPARRAEPATTERTASADGRPAPAFASTPPGIAPAGSSATTVVDGATARVLAEPVAEHVDGVIERDPGVNRSLLLRLIAGVRGL